MRSDAQKRADKKYRASHYKQMKIDVTIEYMKTLDFYCKLHNISKAGFIRSAVWEKMEREEGIPDLPEETTNL